MLEERFAAIVESSTDAIWAEAPDGTVSSWNPAAERLYGYAPEEMLGKSATRLLPDDRLAEHEWIERRVRSGERVAYHETVHLARDGRAIDVSLTVSEVLGESGENAGLAVIARDVSDHAEAARELARTRAELEARARELERSNAELAQFAYVVSHDLSEPLRAISGFLGLLERRHGDALDEEAARYVGRTVEAAERMRMLIDDLLAYSRAGRDLPEPEPVDCSEVLRRAVASLDSVIADAGAEIVAGRLPVVAGNRGQLEHVFQNLLSNAVKFRGEAPSTIEVRAARTAEGWQISVLDDGIGIDPRYAERIFLVFKRLHGRSAYPGTGIGLAISKRIVEAHGGRIWCEPRPEGGTTFHFTLPPAIED
jgi:PAS domain S-box-containing protein